MPPAFDEAMATRPVDAGSEPAAPRADAASDPLEAQLDLGWRLAADMMVAARVPVRRARRPALLLRRQALQIGDDVEMRITAAVKARFGLTPGSPFGLPMTSFSFARGRRE